MTRSVASSPTSTGADGSSVMVVANYTPEPHEGYRIGAPEAGPWWVVANSDDLRWGGSGYPCPDRHDSEPVASGHWHDSLVMTLPPLAIVVLSPHPPSPS